MLIKVSKRFICTMSLASTKDFVRDTNNFVKSKYKTIPD